MAAQYLAHLVSLREFEAAARLCPELLQARCCASVILHGRNQLTYLAEVYDQIGK